ncbi:MAG: hypothetical protein ABSD99_07930 [Candidatus Bathyarchaeia archaeon]
MKHIPPQTNVKGRSGKERIESRKPTKLEPSVEALASKLIRSSSSQINCVQRRRLQIKDQPKGPQLSVAPNLTPNHSGEIAL